MRGFYTCIHSPQKTIVPTVGILVLSWDLWLIQHRDDHCEIKTLASGFFYILGAVKWTGD